MPRKQRSLRESAYEEIKRQVITLELAPGARIDDRKLGAQLELSRTPIREAIFRLGAEGLIDLHENGFVVRPLDLVDIANFFEAHIVLSPAVARLAARRATQEQLEHLRDAVGDVAAFIEKRDYLGITSSNARLHRIEADAANSIHLRKMAESLHDHGQRLAYLCYGGRGGYRGEDIEDYLGIIMKQHALLYAAIADNAPDAAEAVAIEHVHTFRKRVRQFLNGASADDLAISRIGVNVDSLGAP
jgi:DNA-binding GntR family transcriptional regulator